MQGCYCVIELNAAGWIAFGAACMKGVWFWIGWFLAQHIFIKIVSEKSL